MKQIICIVQAFKAEAVVAALEGIPLSEINVSQVRGYGRQKGHLELYRDTEYAVSFLPKVRLELVVSDEQAEEAIQRIVRTARTGRIGDGKILVLPAEEVD
jgi:nitrogen regulatory protein P-II 1